MDGADATARRCAVGVRLRYQPLLRQVAPDRRAAGHTGDAQVLPTLTKVRAGIPLQWIMQLILYRRCVVCDVIVAQCPRML